MDIKILNALLSTGMRNCPRVRTQRSPSASDGRAGAPHARQLHLPPREGRRQRDPAPLRHQRELTATARCRMEAVLIVMHFTAS